MALEVTGLDRKFKFEKDGEEVVLQDPNPNMSTAEVIQHYSVQYPELTTCTIDGPKVDGSVALYEFKTTVGTKG